MSDDNMRLTQTLVEAIIKQIKDATDKNTETVQILISSVNSQSSSLRELLTAVTSTPTRQDLFNKIVDHNDKCDIRRREIEKSITDSSSRICVESSSLEGKTEDNTKKILDLITKREKEVDDKLTAFKASVDSSITEVKKSVVEIDIKLKQLFWVIGIAFTAASIVIAAIKMLWIR